MCRGVPNPQISFAAHTKHVGSTVLYLELKPRLHLLAEHCSNVLIEALHHAHSELRLDPTTADQLIEGVCEGLTDAVNTLARRYAA